MVFGTVRLQKPRTFYQRGFTASATGPVKLRVYSEGIGGNASTKGTYKRGFLIRERCIGALLLRKSCCSNGLSQDQGESRCKQSVTRICLDLHASRGAR